MGQPSCQKLQETIVKRVYIVLISNLGRQSFMLLLSLPRQTKRTQVVAFQVKYFPK